MGSDYLIGSVALDHLAALGGFCLLMIIMAEFTEKRKKNGKIPTANLLLFVFVALFGLFALFILFFIIN